MVTVLEPRRSEARGVPVVEEGVVAPGYEKGAHLWEIALALWGYEASEKCPIAVV